MGRKTNMLHRSSPGLSFGISSIRLEKEDRRKVSGQSNVWTEIITGKFNFLE
jgi:hypothetical protein